MKTQMFRKIILLVLACCICFISGCEIVNPSNTAEIVEVQGPSWEYHLRLKKESRFRNLKWRSLGPAYCGGRIESIACPAGYTSTIYVGAGSGNLWKTENNGTTWKPIFDNESTFAIGSVAVAPSDPDIVWVGTGEVLMARSSYAGTGVFKSTDAGESWSNMGLADTFHIARVLIDPVNPDVVYVAAIGHNYTHNEQRGLFKTTNGGRTWKKVLYVSEKVGCVEVIMDPKDRKTLYAVMWQRDRKVWNNVVCGTGSGIYKSTDAGQSWKQLTNGLPTGEKVGRFGIAIAPSNPNIVYALLDNQSQRQDGKRAIGGEVYRSDDKGASWRKVNKGDLPTAIGYDFCLIRVSPDNPEQLYVLGNYLLTSTDGGKSYKRNQGKVINLRPHGSRTIHLDHHDMWIDPLNPDRLLNGIDGGLYTSYDRGSTWLRVNNFPITEVYAVSVDMADPYNIYIGTQDNAAMYGPSDFTLTDQALEPWKHVYLDPWGGGDSYFTWVDPNDSDTIYYEHQFGGLRRKNMRTGDTKSIRPESSQDEPKLRFNWMTPFLISHYDSSTLYCGANKLFKSTDRGNTWTTISGDLSGQSNEQRHGNVPYGTITTISESRLKHGLLYVGTDDGNIHVTQNDGMTWARINEHLPAKWVSRLRASMHEEGTVYASFTGYRQDDFEKYLYMSTDFGRTWKSIGSNLPHESINVIDEDPRDRDILYVGTDLGIYVSLDQGRSWESLCSNLPTTPVHDLVVHPRQHELVIGTHGRGVFILDVKSILKYKLNKSL
ncbi:MAG: hypothetical protein K9M75_08900 [Phycisphaerae bacterium]|nr:hypothetical protein [Phycisphaerae bacterium]